MVKKMHESDSSDYAVLQVTPEGKTHTCAMLRVNGRPLELQIHTGVELFLISKETYHWLWSRASVPVLKDITVHLWT